MGDGHTKVISINRTPGDFVRDTQHLTALEIGVYNQICDNIVILGQDENPPSIPDDDSFVASIVKLSRGAWKKMKPRLCTGPLAVLVLEDGRISQARVVEEIEAARVRIAVSTKAGIASGASRRRKAAVLRERMLNGSSNGGSTSVAIPFSGSREEPSNSTRTSHESRVTSNEESKTKSKALSPSATPKRPSAEDLVESFALDDSHRIWAAQKCPSVPVDAEFEDWRDRLRSNGYRTNQGPVRDPAASWRTAMKNAEKWGTYAKRGGSNGNHRPERGSGGNGGASETGASAQNPLGNFGMRDARDVLRELQAAGKLPQVPKPAES